MRQKECKKCKICGNEYDNTLYIVKERQLNLGEHFRYLYCSKCGTLSLVDEIEDISRYYPEHYYSFVDEDDRQKNRIICFGRKCFMMYNVTFGFFPLFRNRLKKVLMPYMYLSKTGVKFDAQILDVGCGNGKWLRLLKGCGYRNLYGIDLLCDGNLVEGIHYKQSDIFDNSLKKYDLITFHHSFEHMENPEKVLRRVKELLSTNGLCIIRIPVMESEAWNRWETDWYQIDAPRHFFLYTERSLRYLCEKVGLGIKAIEYDSDPRQFVYSRYYKETDMCLSEVIKNVKEYDLQMSEKLTNEVNWNGRGDQAVFYIKQI